MSSINLDTFVDINIVESKLTSIDSTRDTTILYCLAANLDGMTANTTYSSLEEMYDDIIEIGEEGYSEASNMYKFAYIYFRNGGAKLKIKTYTSSLSKEDLQELDKKEIVVAVLEGTYSSVSTLANSLDFVGGNQKILLASTNANVTDNINNLAVKYSTVVGAEMSIAAYLSKINVYEINNINDYAYTKEINGLEETSATDSIIQNAISNHYNIDIQLANSVRNIGGDMLNGADLVNHYVLIILHQTLQENLVDLLSQKIKGSQGIASIYATISAELNKYVSSGYLITDKIWTNLTLKVTDSYGVSYTIINQNTPLTKGYHIKILPLASLSVQDKQAHKAPKIYIILATTYGIRVIEIEGETI